MWTSVSASWLLLLERRRRRRRRCWVHLNRRRGCALCSVCQRLIHREDSQDRATHGHRPQSCKAASRRPKPPRIAAALFVAPVRTDKPAPPPHSRSVALRKKTWNDAFLCLIKAQPHSPGSTGLLGRPRGRLYTFSPPNHPSYRDAPCSHARLRLQVPGEAEAALPVSALQQGDEGAGPSVYLWPSVLWHLSARIPQVRGVFVCSHEAGETKASFGRATVNNRCVGVSSPSPQPACAFILLWWPPPPPHDNTWATCRDYFVFIYSEKNVTKDTGEVSRLHLSVACHCSAGGGGGGLFFCDGCIICWSEKRFATMKMLQISNHPSSLR